MATITSRLERNFQMLQLLMERAQSLVAASVDSCNPLSDGHELRNVISRICSAQQDILPDLHDDAPWASLTSGSAAADRLFAGYASYVTAYTALLLAAVRRFQQIEHTVISQPSQLQEMTLLWNIITYATQFQHKWPACWPQVRQDQKLASHAALGSLMAWQLDFIRGPGTEWSLTQSSSTPRDLQVCMLGTTEAALTLIKPLLSLGSCKLRSALSQLPSSFISNVCCFAVETLGPSLRTLAAQPQPADSQKLGLNQPTGDSQAMFEAQSDNFLACIQTLSILLTALQHFFVDPDDGTWSQQRSNTNETEDLRPAMFELAKLTLLACSARWVRPAAAAQEEVKLTAPIVILSLELMELLMGHEDSPLFLKTPPPQTQPQQMHMSAAPHGSTSSSSSTSFSGGSQNGHSSNGSGGIIPNSNSGNISSSNSMITSRCTSASSTALVQQSIPRTTTCNLQLLSVMCEFTEEFPAEAFSVIRLFLHFTGTSGRECAFPANPYVLKGLLCASRYIDARVSLLSVGGKLALLSPARKEWQRKIMLHEAAGLAEVQRLMEQLVSMLQGLIFTGSRHLSCPTAQQWVLMPGSATTLEALLREQHSPASTADTFACVFGTTIFVHTLLSSSNHAGVPVSSTAAAACISLAATMNKLMVKLPPLSQGASDLVRECTSFDMMGLCTQGLIRVVQELSLSENLVNTTLLRGGGGSGMGRSQFSDSASGAYRGSSRTKSSDKSRGTGSNIRRKSSRSSTQQSSATTQGSTSARRQTASDTARSTCCKPEQVLRLKAVLVMTLTHILERKHLLAKHCIIVHISPEEQQADLTALATFMMQLFPAALAASLMCWFNSEQPLDRTKMWQDFAGTHCQGRLLPGCCHLGCINLDGISEAALPTQLCSGCRRVRYCSSKCQRAAWVEDGHNLVCGKGLWRPVD